MHLQWEAAEITIASKTQTCYYSFVDVHYSSLWVQYSIRLCEIQSFDTNNKSQS